MLAVVIKRGFKVGKKVVDQGSIIDTEGMRNAETALRTRHLRPASASEIATHHEKQKGSK